MPTDLFYACFSGKFDWNADGDDVYGERTDSIDMSPSIFVTRVPVRTVDDVNAFTSKLLAYEKTPKSNGWNNNILMAGNKLKKYYSSQSDAERKGDSLFINHIQPYWEDGMRVKFYDTYTDFPDSASYVLNQYHLQDQLSDGYTFLDMITHGAYFFWVLERGSYSSSHASSLINNGFTIITTMACDTNAFDTVNDSVNYDPCLSEAFIRNANSGVLAYLGCSRTGWYSTDSTKLGTSLEYEALFYEDLFSSDIQEKNYGAVVAMAKAAMINSCNLTDYPKASDLYRWVQFGLNPIGDPEMPIFTTTPKDFSNSSIVCYEDSLTVHTGIAGCTVCVMSSDDNGNSYFQVKREVENVTFHGTPSDVSICITKQNYIPKVILANLYIQNDTITESRVFEANCIKVGTAVISSKPSGPVVFNGGTIQLKANSVVFEPETTIESGTELIISNQ